MNLSHADEFILLAEVSRERRGDVEVNQVHRATQQVAHSRAHAVEKSGRQARDGEVEIGIGLEAALGRGAEKINFASAAAFSSTAARSISFLTSLLMLGL